MDYGLCYESMKVFFKSAALPYAPIPFFQNMHGKMFTSYSLPAKLSFLYIFQIQCLKNTHIQKSKNAGGGCTVLSFKF